MTLYVSSKANFHAQWLETASEKCQKEDLQTVILRALDEVKLRNKSMIVVY